MFIEIEKDKVLIVSKSYIIRGELHDLSLIIDTARKKDLK